MRDERLPRLNAATSAGRHNQVGTLQFLATVCDIFGCGPENLLTYTSSTRTKKAASAGNVVDLDKTVRPTRARIIPDAD
jgi:hypothetical protein